MIKKKNTPIIEGFKKLGTRAPNLLMMVFLFGLIHGLGLSTRLQTFDMGQDQFLLKIISFNVGVELGQIVALIPIILLINVWRDKASYEAFYKASNVYLIIAGSFPNMKDALNQKKVFEGLGFDVEISKVAGNKFRVIVDQANTLGEAQEILSDLKEKGYKGWINQCNCCKMNEEEHLLNRRTDFKIIRL